MHQYTVLGVALVVATALLSGCGGKAADSDAGSAPVTGAPTADEAEMTEPDAQDAPDAEAGTEEKASEDGGFSISGEGFEFKAGDDGITIKSDEGEASMQFGEGAAIPKGFPKDVPMYDGLAITGAISGALGEEGYSVSGTTADGVAEVADTLKAAAEREGWKEEVVMSQGSDTRMLSYSKDKRNLTYIVTKSDEGASVQITVAGE